MEEFRKRWQKMSPYQRKFCECYLQNGMNARQAAIDAGYGQLYVKVPYKIMRKVKDVLDFLIAKNQIVATLIRPEWIISEYKKLYDKTTSEITKQNILKDLAKILNMTNESTQVNISNNIPTTPVQIVFSDNDTEKIK